MIQNWRITQFERIFYIQYFGRSESLIKNQTKMYLEKRQRNKYTIGKVFRKLKGLRRVDPTAQIVPMPQELQQYVNELSQNGLQVKNLKFAMFQTKNGLKYPGLVATDSVESNTILVKVPVNLLLTTRDAFMSDIQKVFVENPGFYAKRFTGEWEDRILLTYLLYEYQKGKKSRWFNLIRNLPRDIDYAIFWNKQEIQFLEDQHFHRHILSEKQKFDEECSELMQILKNYPEFFDAATINKENIIWLHTHLVTRCFGKYFQYTTMVPFAQLFNHECSDVYYTMFYKPGNPDDQGEEFYPEKHLTQEEMDECDSSDGSYEADDFFQEDENINPFQEVNWSLDKEEYGAEVVKDINSIRIHMFTFINFSDSISLHYVCQIIEALLGTTKIQSWENRKKKCEQVHATNVKYIKKVKQFYNKINRKYYSYGVKQKKNAPKIQPKDDPTPGQNYFTQEWKKDKFDEFYMLCSTKDQFEKGAQVFFCYGRLPNKLLLMRYGFALEHNKYDHMFLKIDVTQDVLNNAVIKTVMGEINIKKYKRFKVKRTKISRQILTYFRAQFWTYEKPLQEIFMVTDIQREYNVIERAKQLYIDRLGQYKCPLHKNQEELKNVSIGYHEYFALVYKIQQQRILTEQLKMLEYAGEVLKKIQNGGAMKQILIQQKQPANLTMQIMMQSYFKTFQIVKN